MVMISDLEIFYVGLGWIWGKQVWFWVPNLF